MNNAIIFGGGTISGVKNHDFFPVDDKENRYIICVDKGIEYAIENDIEIDVVIGDFDSADKKYLKYIEENNIKTLKYDVNKDASDLELALDYCIDNKIDDVIIYGATGTRFDHSLSNIFLLKRYSKKGLNLKIIDKNNLIIYTENRLNIDKTNSYLSILPTDDEAIISLKGTKWPLNYHKLKYGSTYTNSNEFLDNVVIEIHEGSVFVILSID